MTITEFLAARLGEDQQAADAMRHYADSSEAYSCPATRSEPLGDLAWGEEACDCGLAEKKARALREIEAKRAIVARYARFSGGKNGYGSLLDKVTAPPIAAAMRPALLDIAAIWSNHPDYDQGWKP